MGLIDSEKAIKALTHWETEATDEEIIYTINNLPTIEAIPKADYEARLKADMIAILTEIKLKIAEKSYCDTTIIGNYEDEVRINLVELDDVNEIIIEKINELKERI